MTLQTSGPISLQDVATEYGVPLSTPFPSGYYGKPGMPANGPFSLEQCYGLSNTKFTPDGGNVSDDEIAPTNAHVTLSCTTPAVWTYSVASGGSGSSVSVASGGTASSINFLQSTLGTTVWNVSATSNGITRTFTVTLTKETSA